ncbi:NADPH:quinone reductase [Xanthoria calcicola]
MAPIPKMMKAIQIETTGGTEVLQYKDIPVPTPKDNELLISNEFIGVNYIDTYFRTGLYPSPKPMILGREASGTIAALGPQVPGSLGFANGDRVVYMGTSAYAEYTACPAEKVMKIPPGITSSDAGAAFLQGLTALTLVEETHKVQSGDWVLVLAATGGVGGWLCQILRAKGAKTIGTVGSEGKVDIAKQQGADVVVIDRPGQGDVLKTVKECTDGQGVAAVFDGVGKDTFERSLECVARKGTYVSAATNSDAYTLPSLLTRKKLLTQAGSQQGSKLRQRQRSRRALLDLVSSYHRSAHKESLTDLRKTPSKLSAKNAKVARPTLFNYLFTREELEHYSTRLFNMMMDEKFSVRIHDTYPLADVARAHTVRGFTLPI